MLKVGAAQAAALIAVLGRRCGMSFSPAQPVHCHDCGCPGEAGEFLRRRIQRPKQSGQGKVFLKVALCPACAARYDQAARDGGSRCDHCGARVAPGEGHVRTKTDTQVTGALPYHRTVQGFLCPGCAEGYDDAGGQLIKGMLILLGVLLGLEVIGWIFSR
jgi:hypothetical protein